MELPYHYKEDIGVDINTSQLVRIRLVQVPVNCCCLNEVCIHQIRHVICKGLFNLQLAGAAMSLFLVPMQCNHYSLCAHSFDYSGPELAGFVCRDSGGSRPS